MRFDPAEAVALVRAAGVSGQAVTIAVLGRDEAGLAVANVFAKSLGAARIEATVTVADQTPASRPRTRRTSWSPPSVDRRLRWWCVSRQW